MAKGSKPIALLDILAAIEDLTSGPAANTFESKRKPKQKS